MSGHCCYWFWTTLFKNTDLEKKYSDDVGEGVNSTVCWWLPDSLKSQKSHTKAHTLVGLKGSLGNLTEPGFPMCGIGVGSCFGPLAWERNPARGWSRLFLHSAWFPDSRCSLDINPPSVVDTLQLELHVVPPEFPTAWRDLWVSCLDVNAALSASMCHTLFSGPRSG